MLPVFHQCIHQTSGYPDPDNALKSRGFPLLHNPDALLPHRPCLLSSGPGNARHHPGQNSKGAGTHSGPHTPSKMHSDDFSSYAASCRTVCAWLRRRTDNPLNPPVPSPQNHPTPLNEETLPPPHRPNKF